jgi:small-conductance mechanosensitive channel
MASWDFIGSWNELLTNNTNSEFLVAFIIFIVLSVVLKFFDSYFIYILGKATKKTKNNFDDIIIGFLEGLHLPFYIYISFFIAMQFLELPNFFYSIILNVLILFLVFYGAQGVIGISNHLIDKYKEVKEKKGVKQSESMLGVLKLIFKIIIWVVALLMLLSNFGLEITPLIASLGIGGVAIALALQAVLGDLFSAFAIYFDKPFEEGDFIIIGDDMGVVKHIGIKSTRIQALGGQELVISNSELTSTRVNNYKRMPQRRVVFGFGVEYDTSVEQLKKIKKIVEAIIEKTDNAKLDRVHFKEFGDSSLNFEVVYYLNSADYNLYMDVQEKINFEIKNKVEKLGVGFAFPTTTIHFFDESKKK